MTLENKISNIKKMIKEGILEHLKGKKKYENIIRCEYMQNTLLSSMSFINHIWWFEQKL